MKVKTFWLGSVPYSLGSERATSTQRGLLGDSSSSQPRKPFLCPGLALWHGLLAPREQRSVNGPAACSQSSERLRTALLMAKSNRPPCFQRWKSAPERVLLKWKNAKTGESSRWQNSGEHITRLWVPGGQGMKDAVRSKRPISHAVGHDPEFLFWTHSSGIKASRLGQKATGSILVRGCVAVSVCLRESVSVSRLHSR